MFARRSRFGVQPGPPTPVYPPPLQRNRRMTEIMELLPCPFCGGPATAWARNTEGNSPSVWCQNSVACGAEVCLPDERFDAIAAWNTRAAYEVMARSDGWLPIESGLEAVEEFHTVLIARDHGKRCVMPGFFDGEHWRSVSIVGPMEFVNPTHWRPLPAPPAPASSQDTAQAQSVSPLNEEDA